MTKVTIYKSADDVIKGFLADGHAGFASRGNDIVCAGISILVTTAINSIKELTSDGFKTEIDEKRGRIKLMLDEDKPSIESETILNSLVLGLNMISNDYGKGYIKITFKEV